MSKVPYIRSAVRGNIIMQKMSYIKTLGMCESGWNECMNKGKAVIE